MAGARRGMINGGDLIQISRSNSSRLIPKRGQVKVAIVVGLAHTVAAIFSPINRRTAAAAAASRCSQA